MECEACGHHDPQYLCGDCRDTAYCDEACQRADFDLHTEYECIGKRGQRKLSKRQRAKFQRVMREFGEGTLHSGSAKGPIVRDKKQALAIAYAEARKI